MIVLTEVPLGERIGPFIFWPVLVLLIAVIVWAYARILRPSSRRRAPQKTWMRPEDYADHHRVAWRSGTGGFVPEAIHWPLAVAAVFGICTGDPWDELRFRRLGGPRTGLKESWSIGSRPELLRTLHWLLREGHRVDFAIEVEGWSELDQRELDHLLADAGDPSSESDREQLWRLRQVRNDARGIRATKFEAWDLVRAAMLCRAGRSLDWLTEEEAVDTMNLLSARLQQTYSGWAEMGEHFLRARWFWGGNSGPQSRQEDAHDASRQAALLDPARGPWARVPWTLPIPRSRLLLVDALIAEQELVQLPISSPTELAQVIDRATAARLRGDYGTIEST